MGVDLMDIVDSYYQNVKCDWNSDAHIIARRLVHESGQDHYDKMLLQEENKQLKAQLDQAVEALKGLGVYGGNEWCFCQDDPDPAHSDKCLGAKHAIAATEDE